MSWITNLRPWVFWIRKRGNIFSINLLFLNAFYVFRYSWFEYFSFILDFSILLIIHSYAPDTINTDKLITGRWGAKKTFWLFILEEISAPRCSVESKMSSKALGDNLLIIRLKRRSLTTRKIVGFESFFSIT